MIQKTPIKKARAVFLQEGKLLVVPSTRRKNMWVLPGGHVEERESYVKTLIRELHEELNVVVALSDLEHLSTYTLSAGGGSAFGGKAPKGRGKIITALYLVRTWEGTLTPSGDITGMQWVTSEEVKANTIHYGAGILRHVVPVLKKRGLLA